MEQQEHDLTWCSPRKARQNRTSHYKPHITHKRIKQGLNRKPGPQYQYLTGETNKAREDNQKGRKALGSDWLEDQRGLIKA